MAIFSNLDGTMKKTFTLGKKGAILSYDSDKKDISVKNSVDSTYIPVMAGNPTQPEHLVTLDYFSKTVGASPILSGTTIPEITLGDNGNLYIQVDDVNILKIYYKHDGKWKTFS